MAKRHLKGIAVPRTWNIHRKENVFVTRPHPGAHPMLYSMPLNLIMKELIKCAQTTREVRYILKMRQVLGDGVRRAEYKLPVGLMDVVSLPDIGEQYRIVLNQKGKLAAVPIAKDEATVKPCRVMGKTLIGKGRFQLNLSGNRNIIMSKAEYAVGDTLLITLPKQEVKQHLKLENGALIYLTGGKHIGSTGTVEGIVGNTVRFKAGKDVYEAPKRCVFVLGKEKAMITIC